MAQPDTPFAGLAPFLRMNLNGGDLAALARTMLAQAQQEFDNAGLWMNLSTVMFTLGQRELGLTIQNEALQMRRLYRLAPEGPPAKSRLLLLVTAGDIAENTPLDCLLEGSSVELIYWYATPGLPLPRPVPEHDAVLVAIGESAQNRALLDTLESLLADWPRPVVNAPRHIRNADREVASDLLQGVPGLLIPPTRPVSRAMLERVARGGTDVGAIIDGCSFPVIVRPVGSQAGHDLARLGTAGEIAGYLSRVAATEFFLAPFVDYSGADGLFRKYRVALIAGRPYACHMGISAHWMIHYVNAGMYDDAAKRAEEASFMERFDAFAARHRGALDAIHQRSGLDYVCIDCGETAGGDLLIFEIDHVMVVHAMDPVAMFPYKQVHMRKVREAFERFLSGLGRDGTVPRGQTPIIASNATGR